MKDFTWSQISLAFPEWNDMTVKEYGLGFSKVPEYSGNKIKSEVEGYGLQITLEHKLPEWIKEDKERVQRMYKDLSEQLYNEIVSEIKKSIPIFETWRGFLRKYDKNQWTGNLQDHLDFIQKYETLGLYDYYRFYPDSEMKDNSPVEIINKIHKLPKDSLNEKWLNYYKLSEIVDENKIVGKTLTECIQNADKIYKLAPELKDLKF